MKDTTPVAELTATPETDPETTDSVTASLLASVTVRVCKLEYDCPASTASVTSGFSIVGAKLATKYQVEIHVVSVLPVGHDRPLLKAAVAQ